MPTFTDAHCIGFRMGPTSISRKSQAVGIGMSRDLRVNSRKENVNNKLKIEVNISLKTKCVLKIIL